MGGLLALNASIDFSDCICGVFAIAPPLKMNLSVKSLAAKFRLLTYRKKHEIKCAYTEANSIGKAFFLYCALWLKPFLQLKKLMKATRKKLPYVSVPVTLIHSKNDETVSFKSAAIFAEGLAPLPAKTITLNDSMHAYYTKAERQCIAEELCWFIENTAV